MDCTSIHRYQTFVAFRPFRGNVFIYQSIVPDDPFAFTSPTWEHRRQVLEQLGGPSKCMMLQVYTKQSKVGGKIHNNFFFDGGDLINTTQHPATKPESIFHLAKTWGGEKPFKVLSPLDPSAPKNKKTNVPKTRSANFRVYGRWLVSSRHLNHLDDNRSHDLPASNPMASFYYPSVADDATAGAFRFISAVRSYLKKRAYPTDNEVPLNERPQQLHHHIVSSITEDGKIEAFFTTPTAAGTEERVSKRVRLI